MIKDSIKVIVTEMQHLTLVQAVDLLKLLTTHYDYMLMTTDTVPEDDVLRKDVVEALKEVV